MASGRSNSERISAVRTSVWFGPEEAQSDFARGRDPSLPRCLALAWPARADWYIRGVRVLRLSNSNDSHPTVPEDLRAPAVAARRIAELTGEPVETEIRSIWPSARLGDIVAAMIEGSEPDVVLVRASSFWVNFESVPRKVERQFGGLAAPIARAGRNAGARYPVATSRAFKFVRILAVRTVGGTPYFTPSEATEHL